MNPRSPRKRDDYFETGSDSPPTKRSSAAAAVCWGFGPEFLLGSDLELVGRADLEKEGRS
jgi:hypothetical protein